MKYKVTLNGKTYEVEVEHGKAVLLDEYEALAPAPAAPAAAPSAPAAVAAAPAPVAPVNLAAGETVTSPMPGNIIRVDVNQGDTVKAGQLLIILEAMKMENEIVAPKDGTVVQVVTSKGSVVDTGAPLVVIA
ncbi:MAG: biotin/lipoyl-binding protein [Ruminococcus sp.]|nr:biotin/lipoyl-binding protein [Ruminococcus sp.]